MNKVYIKYFLSTFGYEFRNSKNKVAENEEFEH